MNAVPTLRQLAKNAIQGPYFVGCDEATDTSPHRNSGLALVDTGRSQDWPVARLCEWPTARYIARCDPATMLAVYGALERASKATYQTVTNKKIPLRSAIEAQRVLRLLDGVTDNAGK